MSDGEYSSAAPLSCGPEPLSSSMDDEYGMSSAPASFTPASSATPSYLASPTPAVSTPARSDPRRRVGAAATTSDRRIVRPPDVPADPAAARRRYREGANWGPPPEPNMSIMPTSTAEGLSCEPSNMSCPAPDGSEMPPAESRTEGEASAPGASGSDGPATSGAGGAAGAEGSETRVRERGPSAAQERERKFQERQEDLALAIPFTPLKVPEAETGDRRLYPLYIQVPSSGPGWTAPSQLEVTPIGDKQKIPRQYADYEQQFASAAGTARSLYEQILAEGREQTALAARQLDEVRSDAQTELDRNNAMLDEELASERKRLAQGESDAIHRLELIADTARLLVRLAASRVLGTLSVRKGVIRARMIDAESEIASIEYRLVGYQASIARTGAQASAAFTRLSSDPALARVRPGENSDTRYEPQMTRAMNESPPMDNVIVARAANRAEAFTNGARVFGARMTTAMTQFDQGKTNALAPFQSYVTMLGTTAPQQVAKMRKDALKTIDRMEKRAKRTIQENRNTSDIALVERHKTARAQTLAQAQANMAGQARGMERNAIGQWRSYAGLASAQSQAILALKQQIAGQRTQQPEAFAKFAIQASQRTASMAGSMANQRLALLATTAIRTRGGIGLRAALAAKAQQGTSEKLATQIEALARQAAQSMLENVLRQEATLRQSAEPIAKSVDNYTIPATAELDAMEVALWDALGLAQRQANQAYFGGGPPGEEGGEATSEGPPPGTGQLPHEFVELSTSLAAAPETEQQLTGLTAHIAGEVRNKVETKGAAVEGQMNKYNDPVATMAAVRGLTALQGAAVSKFYAARNGGASLLDDGYWYLNIGNLTMAVSTYEYYINAFYNYLSGNRAAGALWEVQAAANYSNNDEQAQAAMMALTPADMSALRNIEGSGAILDGVARDLGGNQERAFNLLREVTPANAAEKVAAARSVLLTGTITSDLDRGLDTGADAAADHMAAAHGQAGRSTLESGDVYAQYGLVLGPEMRTGSDAVSRPGDPAPLRDDYRFETSAERNARTANSWNMTVARLGTDGTLPTDGTPAGLDWLRSTLTRRRTETRSRGRAGTYEVDISIRPEQVDLIMDMAQFGADHPRVRARRMIVEETRTGGPNLTRVGTALQDDLGNAGLLNPDTPMTAQQREQLAAAAQREADLYHYYDCFKRNINNETTIAETPRRPVEHIKRELGLLLSARAGGGTAGDLLYRQVVHGLNDPATAALAFYHAVNGAGTNEQMLKDTFGRMSPEQVTAAVEYYDSHYGPPGLYERLGIFGEAQGLLDFPELSGDDAIDIQVLAMGRARNDRERFERSRMTSHLHRQARDRWYSTGSLFAGDESRRMDQSHAEIMQTAGVTNADFDRFGRLIRRDGRYLGRWNSDGSFAPVARDSAGNARPGAIYDSLAFAAALNTNQANVEAYKVAIDNIASTITTAIIVVTAIITTAVTFGGAASIWIPMAIAAAGGLAAMAVNATLKGGRYGYEDAFRDLGMTIVQAATAGLASGLNIAAVGGKAALSAALTSRMVVLGATKAPSLLTQIGIGAATGAFGGAGNALFDDAAWDRGDWLSGIGHGFLKGGLSGGAAGGITAGLTAGAQALARPLGRLAGLRDATARGLTGMAAAREAVRRGQQFAGSFALSQATRTIGGGLGGAASRYIEIEYDRSRGRYAGTRSQAMDEIFAAGLQNAIQSYGEGSAEHAMQNSTRAGNLQRRYIDAFIVREGADTVIHRRPAANDNSNPEINRIWAAYGQRLPTGGNEAEVRRAQQGQADADRALRSANPVEKSQAIEARHLARIRAAEAALAAAEAEARQRAPEAANDNDPAAATRPLPADLDADGNVISRLPPPDTEAEPSFAARSTITDEAETAAMLLRRDSDLDPERAVRTYDPDKTPVDGTPAITQKDLDTLYAEQQKLAPRTLDQHIEAYDATIGRRIYDTVDLTDRHLTRLGHMPENSRIMATNPHDLDAALHNYHKMRTHDTNREVLLIQDRVTGMYMVVQGGPGRVIVPAGDWNVLQHSHPRILTDDLNAALVRSIPSGKPGDINTVALEVDAIVARAPAGMVISRTSVIDIQIADAAGNITVYQTKFGVIGQGADRAIWVEFHNPKNGYVLERHAFQNLAEYEAHVLKTTGVDISKPAADAVLTVDPARTARPSIGHGDAIPPTLRADIDFVAGRMAMHTDFDAQVQGLRARGELDPHLGRAAALEDAHARVRAMGLVGEPDSMIRLYNILNDPNIPVSVRTLISDITLAATQRHMVETGQLEPGEPLVMLFHGATSARARDMTENGISMARKPGGIGDDFGEGLYFTQHLESAMVYANGKAGVNSDTNGAVIPYVIRGRDLGTIVDVSTGGRHRAAWERFLTAPENREIRRMLTLSMETLRNPAIMRGLDPLQPFPFALLDSEMRGKIFNAFLESLGGPQARPDIIFGDLGGPMTSGVQFRGGVTDQAAVRSQTLADILNAQHILKAASAAADGEMGAVMRSIDAPDADAVVPATKGIAETAPAPVTLAQRLASLGPVDAKAVGDAAIANLRARASKSGDETGVLMTKLLEIDHPLIMRVLLEPDGVVAQKLAQDFHQALLDRGMEPAIALRHMRSLEYVRIRGGARLQVEIAHQLRLAGLDNNVFDGLTSKQRRWVQESPVALALWQHDKALFRELHAGFMRGTGRKASGNTALHFDKYVRQRLQARVKAGNDPSILPLFATIEATRVKVLTERAALKQFLHGRAHVVTPLRPEVKTPPAAGAGIGAEIANVSQYKPGLRVIHSDPALGRGTISAADGDNITFVSDATGATHMYNVTEIHEQGFRLATHADPFFTDPIPLLRSQDEINAITQDIARFRKEAGLPDYVQGDKTTGTVAEIRMNGERFRGTNSGLQPENYPQSIEARRKLFERLRQAGLKSDLPEADLGDAEFLSHAEADALLQAHMRFGALPEVVEIFVDRPTCNDCDSHLIELARMLGVKELRIYYKGEGARTTRVYR